MVRRRAAPKSAPERLKKTYLNHERLSFILEHQDLPNEQLSKLTDGLSVSMIKLIKKVKGEGLRGPQGRK